MKFKLIAAASVVALSAGAAQAQGNVTLYGIVDASIEHLNHAGPDSDSVTHMPGGGANLSRWGLRGSEDLGGGLKAVFTLESGFDLGTGRSQQGGRLFGRQAWVGLAGSWGALHLGRNYSALLYGILPTDPLIANMYVVGAFNGYVAGPRVDNSIAYVGKFGGLGLYGTYSFGHDGNTCPGEAPGEAKQCRQYSAAVTYGVKNWGVGAWFDERNHGAAVPSGDTDRLWEVNGYIAFGQAKFALAWLERKDEAPDAANLPEDSRILKATVSYDMQPVNLIAQYIDYEAQHGANADNDGSDIILRAVYSLSKRTSMYAMTSILDNKGGATFTPNAVAPASHRPNPGKNQTAFAIGLRHLF